METNKLEKLIQKCFPRIYHRDWVPQGEINRTMTRDFYRGMGRIESWITSPFAFLDSQILIMFDIVASRLLASAAKEQINQWFRPDASRTPHGMRTPRQSAKT